MFTPFSDIYDVFESKFQSSTALPDGLKLQWLKSAVTDFKQYIGKILTLDLTNEVFEQNVKDEEKELLGKLMYKYYLVRERDRVSKMANFIGKDIKYTSYGDKNRTFKELISEVENDINYDVARMLTNDN